jgi:hypothetical protein
LACVDVTPRELLAPRHPSGPNHRPQPLGVRAARAKSGAISCHHHILAARERLDLLNTIEIRDGGAMDPHEVVGIEPFLECAHRA